MTNYRLDPQPCRIIPGWMAIIWDGDDIVRVVFGKSRGEVRALADDWYTRQLFYGAKPRLRRR